MFVSFPAATAQLSDYCGLSLILPRNLTYVADPHQKGLSEVASFDSYFLAFS